MNISYACRDTKDRTERHDEATVSSLASSNRDALKNPARENDGRMQERINKGPRIEGCWSRQESRMEIATAGNGPLPPYRLQHSGMNCNP